MLRVRTLRSRCCQRLIIDVLMSSLSSISFVLPLSLPSSRLYQGIIVHSQLAAIRESVASMRSMRDELAIYRQRFGRLT
jgi:hypothetical protein